MLEPAERHVHHARARVASQDDDVGHLPERAVLGKLARGEAAPRPFAVVASDRVLDDPHAARRCDGTRGVARASHQDVRHVDPGSLPRLEIGQAEDVLRRAQWPHAAVTTEPTHRERRARDGEEAVHVAASSERQVRIVHGVRKKTVVLIELGLAVDTRASGDSKPLCAHTGLGEVSAREPVEQSRGLGVGLDVGHDGALDGG